MSDLLKQKLPGGWKMVELGDVCELIRGVNFSPDDSSYSPKDNWMPVLRAGNIQQKINLSDDLIYVKKEKISNHQLLQEGDIAICMSSGSPGVVGKTAYFDDREWIGSVGAFCGIIRPTIVEQKYLSYWFKSPKYFDWRNSQTRGANIQNLRFSELLKIDFLLPPIEEQMRIVAILDETLHAVEEARKATEQELCQIECLITKLIEQSLQTKTKEYRISDCFSEMKKGIGETWSEYPLYGATRNGLAPAKEGVGKNPERYKPVTNGTVLYNPMRINIGSIAILGDDDPPGITSPDYVVINAIDDIIHPLWFYHWLRSYLGEFFISTIARGAVRERMLFNRLAAGRIQLPDYKTQEYTAKKIREIRKLKKLIIEQQELLKLLPQAYLRQAFGGELK